MAYAAKVGALVCALSCSWLSAQAAWETSLRPAPIQNQAGHSYCTIYATAAFLELWGAARAQPKSAFPAVDPAYLAFAYNREVGTMNNGVFYHWLLPPIQKWGALPKGATLEKPFEKVVWPIPDWANLTAKLIAATTAEPFLTASYRLGEATIKPRDFLRDTVGIDFREFVPVWTTHSETYKTETASSSPIVDHYREETKERAAAAIEKLAKAEGIEFHSESLKDDPLYTLSVVQLYQRRPVLMQINTGLTHSNFKSYRTIGLGDLAEEGSGYSWQHAVVAVGHCDREDSRNAACKEFAPQIKSKNIGECIILQNSWGEGAHAKGYVCVSRRAMGRMLQSAVLLKDIVGN